MVPCQVCGKDATGGWIHGFVPSPDSLKVGLCPEHDTQAARRVMKAHWRKLMQREIAAYNTTNEQQHGRVEQQMLALRFVDGGTQEFVCAGCTVQAGVTLQVLLPDGTLRFFPVSRLQQWQLTPIKADVPSPSVAAQPAGGADVS